MTSIDIPSPENLKEKYDKFYEWAKWQTFVTVYRAEGPHIANNNSFWNANLVWSWYTSRFSNVLKYRGIVLKQFGEVKLYSLIIPQSMIDWADPIDKATAEYNVLSSDLREGRREISRIEDATTPNLENYMKQFAWVRKYLGEEHVTT
jgi:hypothetical protein